MGLIQIGRLNIGWGTGNDRFVRTTNSGAWRFSPFVKEQWVTITGNEYELYKTTPELYVVFNRFASMFANGRFVHCKADGTEIENSKLVKFLSQPNPIQSREEFLIESALHYLIYGNRITYPSWATTVSDVPTVMNNLPPNYVKVVLTKKRWDQFTINGIVEKYILENYGTENRTFDPKEIIHHRNVNPDNPFIGESIMNSLHMPISNIRGAYGFRNVNIVRRGALGFVTNKSKDQIGNVPLGLEERTKLEKQFTETTHGIHDGQSSVVISDNEIGWEHTAYPINQMMLFEEISEDFKRIIDAVNLNDNIFSKEKSKIQANLQEGLKMAYQDGIIPFANDFCSGLSKGLRMQSGEYIKIDYSHMPALQEDVVKKSEIEKNKSEAIKRLVESGMTLEQAQAVITFE